MHPFGGVVISNLTKFSYAPDSIVHLQPTHIHLYSELRYVFFISRFRYMKDHIHYDLRVQVCLKEGDYT